MKESRLEIELKGPEQKKEKVDWRDLRILWHSVAPYIRSGYGKVTYYNALGLFNRGFSVICSAYYGLQTPGIVNFKGLFVLPVQKRSDDPLGFYTVRDHYKRLNCDVAVWCADFWVSRKFAELIENSICYSPVDHDSYPEKWLSVFRSYKWVAVASKHGVQVLKKAGIDATYIPHGVDINIFKPMDKLKCRQHFGIPKDLFLFGVVAANNDDEPRKGWDCLFRAFRIFLEQNPNAVKDARLFIHTDPTNERGRNLIELAKQENVDKWIIWNDVYTASVLGLPESSMAKVYNCMDVFVLPSRREGFCLPVLEAQACGIPVIVNGFSALIERVDNGRAGWMVKPATYVYTQLNGLSSIPDPEGFADAMTEAYQSPNKRKYYAKRGLQYARRQTWDVAIDKHWIPFLKEIADEIPRTSKKKLKRIA